MNVDLLGALDHISPNLCRDDWFKVLAGIKSECGDAGYDIARNWSMSGDTYREADFNSTWKSAKANGGVTVGTLYHFAREAGWKPEKVTGHNEPVKLNHLAIEAVRLKAKQQEKETTQTHELVALECADRFNQAVPAEGDHPYLSMKACPAYGIRKEGDNLKTVAETIRKKRPDHHIIIAADSAPESTTEKARAVAQAINAGLAILSVESDFNDLAHADGFDAVKSQVDGAGRVRKPKADMSWIKGFTVTKEEVEEMSNPDWVYENLIIQGHMLVIPAPANGGKTTILQYICAQISGRYSVYYVNADISGGDAKWAHAHAEKYGYTLMLPDMKAGLSMDDVVSQLNLMNQNDADYSAIVFVFDTLKKMTDVIAKSKSKNLYKTLRGLSAKGMTLVLLGHTNKYKDADGRYVFESTGDLRTDVDEMIYMIPKKNDDGSMTVSTDPDKVRGTFEPITFEISADREVTALDTFIDVAAIKKTENQREKDETVIEAITEALEAGKYKQIEIVGHCNEHHKIGWRSLERVLKRYGKPPSKLWSRTKAFEKNAWIYKLEKHSHLSSGKSENWLNW